VICPNCGVSLEKEESTEEKTPESPQPGVGTCLGCGRPWNHEWTSCPYCSNTLPGKPLEKSPPLSPGAQKPFRINDIDFSKIFTKQLLVVGVALGLLIMFLGAATMNVSTINEESPSRKDNAKAAGTHQNGAIVYNLGVLILLFVLYGTAIFNEDMNQFVRLGMLIAAALISFNQIGAGS